MMAAAVDELQTRRLCFRGIDESDSDLIVSWRSDPEVFRYFKNPHQITTEEHCKWFYGNYLSNADRFDWMCLERSTGKKIGVFGLSLQEGNAEVSYLLAKDAQHLGYAREGVEKLTAYAFEKWQVQAVLAEIHKDNIPSIRLVEKLGFILLSKKGSFVRYRKDAFAFKEENA